MLLRCSVVQEASCSGAQHKCQGAKMLWCKGGHVLSGQVLMCSCRPQMLRVLRLRHSRTLLPRCPNAQVLMISDASEDDSLVSTSSDLRAHTLRAWKRIITSPTPPLVPHSPPPNSYPVIPQ